MDRKAAKQIVSSAAALLGAARSVEAAQTLADQELVAAATTVVDRDVRDQLAAMPLESLRGAVSGRVAWSALMDAGYDTVADIQAASAWELVAIDGAPLKPTSPITKPYEIVRRAMRDIGFDTVGDGAHVLRRSGGRNLFQRLQADGHDGALRRVSSMYGHSSVTITEHCLSVDAERRERNDMLAGKPMFAKTA